MKPRKKGEAVTLSLWVDRDLVEVLDRLAEKACLSRNQLANNILRVNLEELDACDKVGIYQMSVLLGNMSEAIKAWVENLKENPDDFKTVVAGR